MQAPLFIIQVIDVMIAKERIDSASTPVDVER